MKGVLFYFNWNMKIKTVGPTWGRKLKQKLFYKIDNHEYINM